MNVYYSNSINNYKVLFYIDFYFNLLLSHYFVFLHLTYYFDCPIIAVEFVDFPAHFPNEYFANFGLDD